MRSVAGLGAIARLVTGLHVGIDIPANHGAIERLVISRTSEIISSALAFGVLVAGDVDVGSACAPGTGVGTGGGTVG